MKKAIFTSFLMLSVTSIAHAQDLDTFRYGSVALKGDAGFMYMPTMPGFADRQGLNIDIHTFRGDALMLRALLSGELDAYLGSPSGPMIAASRGADVRIIGCPWPGLTFALFARPEIKTLEDIEGGIVGVSAPASMPDIFARAVVSVAGLDTSNLTFTSAGSDVERLAAAAAGIITVAPASSEFAASSEQFGLHMVAHAKDYTPQFIRYCIITSGDKIENDADLMERFLVAQMEGFRYALENRDETIALSYEKARLPESDPGPAAIFDEAIAINAINPGMEANVDDLRWMLELLEFTGNIDAGFDPTSILDTEILEAAKARLAEL